MFNLVTILAGDPAMKCGVARSLLCLLNNMGAPSPMQSILKSVNCEAWSRAQAQWRMTMKYLDILVWDSVRKVIMSVCVNTSMSSFWAYFMWNHPSKCFVLLCKGICLGTKFPEPFDDRFCSSLKRSFEPAVNASCPLLWTLVLSQETDCWLSSDASCHLQFELSTEPLCSEQAIHLTVVRRWCVCWIFYLPSDWQQSTIHTYGP